MNIIVLHGEDIKRSYSRFRRFVETAKARAWEIVNIDDSNLSFRETLTAKSLFANERFFILRDIFKLSKKDGEWLRKQNPNLNGNLIIYSDDSIKESILRQLPKTVKIEEFQLPKVIFQFLASFYPGNARRAIILLHEVLKYEPPEFIFALLGRQLRDLYWLKVAPSTLTHPSWRMRILKGQSEKFSEEELAGFISQLAGIDVSSKTGGPLLSESLDLAIISQLE